MTKMRNLDDRIKQMDERLKNKFDELDIKINQKLKKARKLSESVKYDQYQNEVIERIRKQKTKEIHRSRGIRRIVGIIVFAAAIFCFMMVGISSFTITSENTTAVEKSIPLKKETKNNAFRKL